MEHTEFLNTFFADFGFDLQATQSRTAGGVLFNLTGKDTSLFLNDNGEMLDALEHILFQIYGRELPREERFICDAEGFRQTRRMELAAMARFAADNVRKAGIPFTFGVLTASERRAIHMVLAEDEDLQTESVGEGRTRRLQVRLK